MTGVPHALCNAHHLRELKALVEIEKEDWAQRMQRLLRRACHAVNLARAQDLPLRPEMIALIERCYDAVVADGLAYHTAQPALTKARPRQTAVATTTDQCLSVAFRTHEQPGRRRGAVTGSEDIPWTSVLIAGILTPHACPARCGHGVEPNRQVQIGAVLAPQYRQALDPWSSAGPPSPLPSTHTAPPSIRGFSPPSTPSEIILSQALATRNDQGVTTLLLGSVRRRRQGTHEASQMASAVIPRLPATRVPGRGGRSRVNTPRHITLRATRRAVHWC